MEAKSHKDTKHVVLKLHNLLHRTTMETREF